MNYAEKLKDPRWQRKRLEILQRDNFTCTDCGSTKFTLHVHHYSYDNKVNPWEVGNEKLTTLCEHCHYIATFIKESDRNKVIDYVARLIINGKLSDIITINRPKTETNG